MEKNNGSCSVSSVKKSSKSNVAIVKDCKHKFKVIYRNKQICVKSGFERWR